jgi:hypothetical protein
VTGLFVDDVKHVVKRSLPGLGSAPAGEGLGAPNSNVGRPAASVTITASPGALWADWRASPAAVRPGGTRLGRQRLFGLFPPGDVHEKGDGRLVGQAHGSSQSPEPLLTDGGQFRFQLPSAQGAPGSSSIASSTRCASPKPGPGSRCPGPGPRPAAFTLIALLVAGGSRPAQAQERVVMPTAIKIPGRAAIFGFPPGGIP